MADKRIQDLDLVAVDKIDPQDRTVLEHEGDARAIMIQDLVNSILNLADGHGGISKPAELIKSEGLIDTYQFTYADGTTSTFTLKNGDSGVHFGTEPVPRTANVWLDTTDTKNPVLKVRYLPDGPWQSIESLQGDPAIILNQKKEYQASDSGTVEPSGPWSTTFPKVKGRYVWTRTTTTWNHGKPTVFTSPEYQGADGIGQVNLVDGHAPNPSTHGVTLTYWKKDQTIYVSDWGSYSPKGKEETALKAMGYTFRAIIYVDGVTPDMFPLVTLSLPDIEAAGTSIANMMQCTDGGVYIYADSKPSGPITALTVMCRKAAI